MESVTIARCRQFSHCPPSNNSACNGPFLDVRACELQSKKEFRPVRAAAREIHSDTDQLAVNFATTWLLQPCLFMS